MTEHADLELIAAFREGLLDRPEAARLSQHLAQCGVCAEREAAITQVTMRLAAAPDPAMPPELARRLDAALGAEIAAARAAGISGAFGDSGLAAAGAAGGGLSTGRDRPFGPAADHGTTRPATRGAHERRAARRGRGTRSSGPRRPARSRGWMATAVRPLAAAAAICLIAGGGYLLIHSSHSTSPSPSAAGSASPSRHTQAGSAPIPTNGGGSPRLAAPAVYKVHSVTAYRSGQLATQAAAALRKYGSHLVPGAKAGAITMQPFGTAPLSGCVQRFAPRQQRLLVFDRARYDDRPAMVIIAPAASGRSGHVWVVSPDCSASAGTVLASASLPS